MKLKNKRLFIALFVFLALIGVVISLLVPGNKALRIGYVGTSLPREWSGRYLELNGEMSHKLTSDKSELFVDIVTESGSISVLIESEGEKLYSGSALETCSFSVMTGGNVNVTVNGDSHRGSFRFAFDPQEK